MEDPESLNPYQMLIRQSRKMGRVASRSYDVTREFLKQDISRLHPEQLLSPLRSKRTDRDRADIKLKKIVAQSHEVLAAAQTVILPVNLFPDSVVVDRTKVTITKKTFFWSSEVISIRIEDVFNVSTSVGPLFGSLTVSSRIMNSTDHFQINYFWRHDAVHLKNILQGYMIALHNDIEVSHLSRGELIETLTELGHDSRI